MDSESEEEREYREKLEELSILAEIEEQEYWGPPDQDSLCKGILGFDLF
ncbi:hypothetical protein LCGC14_1253770 [marine sediment metagenome]|uniref:Uncharacterized protein n=1 Tax=marine sediment metagenome TaxID=412755 RepID=A0A0F9P669_9ZZZZ